MKTQSVLVLTMTYYTLSFGNPELPLNQSHILGAANSMQGRMAINMAAGDSNAQLNAAALAVTKGLGAHATLDLSQNTQITPSSLAQDAHSLISQGAFSNSQGVLSVNQASGLANAQINAVAIGLGLGAQAISDTTLASSTSVATPLNTQTDSQARGSRRAEINAGAFDGSSGLVQVNQLAGNANATANSFQLSIELGLENQQ